ncbi:protein-glutamate O-methyltransferase CheR [Desulfovibrio aminophilus]|nr:protein-glutamate O-methyltransferase CheR [Desulfovibrio aminophilus]MCM0756152.1 protein-glutamate O-methyltransferase CheR [Desulfovibrio aminophilus]
MSSLFSSTITLGKELKVTDAEFGQLRDFIYAQCGIYVADNRKYLLENRLANRLKQLNLKNFSEYYYYLQYDAGRREELNRLFEVITTNETSFYRNPPQLQVFQEQILTDVLDSLRKSGQKKLRIWSAGCSTGEEPYTLAMIIADVLKGELPTWDVRITANDLSERVLESARRGVYNEYTLRSTPKDVLARHFVKQDSFYAVRPELKKLILYHQINLSDAAQIKRVERSQIVFCRNVIIYFDDEMKKKVIGAFYDNLLPGGYLIIGHSESLHNISRAFKPIHYPGAIIYKKEG